MYRTVVRKAWTAALAACVAALAACVAALAAGSVAEAAAPRQSAAVKFGAKRPGAASGLSVVIDYVNPNDPSAKPYSVKEVVIELQEGTRIDTSVPERCAASDLELMTNGAAACPPRSRVGGGTLDLDDGLMAGPFPRIVHNVVTIFNADRELILLTRSTNTPGPPIRAVAREPVTDRDTLTAGAPPIPGQPPPDPYTAIKRVRTTLDRVVRGKRAFVTTPSRCGPSRAWVNRTRFTYRDGVTQTVFNRSACRPRKPVLRPDRPDDD